MSANVEAMVREGENALKAGRKEEARALLMKAVELDELNEDAWLWLSAVVETPEDQQTCLENVLAINPSNERARQGMKYIEQQRTGVVPAPPPPPVASPPPPPAASKGTISTSVEWSAPEGDSQPTSPPKGMDLSEEDYDDWVSTLNLPATSAKPPVGANPFMIDEDEIDEEPDFEIPFSPPPPAVKEKPAPPPKQPKAKKEKPAPVELPDDDEVEAAPPEPYEPLFPDIPDEIRVTRMPGTNQRIPIPLLVLLALMIGLNIAVALLLVQAVFV